VAKSPSDQDWKSLAEQIRTEMDPSKLSSLVDKLCAALDARRKATQVDTDNKSRTELS
jgi:hypothetical protein